MPLTLARPPLYAAATRPLVRSSFNVADSTDMGITETGQAWQVARTVSGQIISGEAARRSGADDHAGIRVECNRADVLLTQTVIVRNDAANRMSGGFVFRWIDTNNYLIASFNDGAPAQFYIAKLDAGSFSTYTQTAASYSDDTLHTLALIAQGSSIQAYINGVRVLSTTIPGGDSKYITPTQHGIFFGNSAVDDRHDDFVVRAI